jgi:hypothetical protein
LVLGAGAHEFVAELKNNEELDAQIAGKMVMSQTNFHSELEGHSDVFNVSSMARKRSEYKKLLEVYGMTELFPKKD